MSDNSKMNSRKPLGTRVRDWFNGGDPDGRAKIRQWARGYDDKRPEGYTYGMMGPVMGLSILAAILYPLTKGYGSIVALVLAIFLLLGRHLIERQVARVGSDLQEARRQYERTHEPDYLKFVELRASGLLEDNKMLTPSTRTWLNEQVEWAQEQIEKNERRAAKKAARAARRRNSSARAPEGSGNSANSANSGNSAQQEK